MRRLTTMSLLAAVLLAAGPGGAASGATAPAISIGVAPSKLRANLHPGQLYKTDLDIYNKGNVEYRPAVASLMAAGVENRDGTGLVLRGQVLTRSVSVHWISLKDVWHSSDKLGAAMDWLVHPTVTADVEVRNTGNTFFNI